MTGDPLDTLREKLDAIHSTAEFYAKNIEAPAHEADHALRVEITSYAEDAWDALDVVESRLRDAEAQAEKWGARWGEQVADYVEQLHAAQFAASALLERAEEAEEQLAREIELRIDSEPIAVRRAEQAADALRVRAEEAEERAEKDAKWGRFWNNEAVRLTYERDALRVRVDQLTEALDRMTARANHARGLLLAGNHIAAERTLYEALGDPWPDSVQGEFKKRAALAAEVHTDSTSPPERGEAEDDSLWICPVCEAVQEGEGAAEAHREHHRTESASSFMAEKLQGHIDYVRIRPGVAEWTKTGFAGAREDLIDVIEGYAAICATGGQGGYNSAVIEQAIRQFWLAALASKPDVSPSLEAEKFGTSEPENSTAPTPEAEKEADEE